jgi:hypothetical protein
VIHPQTQAAARSVPMLKAAWALLRGVVRDGNGMVRGSGGSWSPTLSTMRLCLGWGTGRGERAWRRATADPSTVQVAKCATCFGGWPRYLIGAYSALGDPCPSELGTGE